MDIHIVQNGKHASVTVYPALPEDEHPLSEVDETEMDEIKASFFKQGWEAASREAMLNFVNGRLIEYFQEIGLDGGADPHHNEPEGTGEQEYSFETRHGDPDFEDNWDTAEPNPDFADWQGREDVVERAAAATPTVVAEDPDIRPVVDSGEPLEEAKTSGGQLFSNGTWTMSDEELQSRLDASYNRGRGDGQLAPRQTTARSLEIMAVEEMARTFPDGTAGMTNRDVFTAFTISIARRLGYEVSA